VALARLALSHLAPHAQTIITDTVARIPANGSPQIESGRARRHPLLSLLPLAGEDLALLPAQSLDAIVIASASITVGDWRGFLRDAGRSAPGRWLASNPGTLPRRVT